MMLFNHSLFWLKNRRFSTNCCKEFIVPLRSVLMFANKQVATFIKSFLGNSPLLHLFQEKNGPEKFLFIATNNWIVLSDWWSVKYFFAPNSLIFRKRHEKKKMEKTVKCKTFCFWSKRNKFHLQTLTTRIII